MTGACPCASPTSAAFLCPQVGRFGRLARSPRGGVAGWGVGDSSTIRGLRVARGGRGVRSDLPGESSVRGPLDDVVIVVRGLRDFSSSICVPIPCKESASSDTPDNAATHNCGGPDMQSVRVRPHATGDGRRRFP